MIRRRDAGAGWFNVKRRARRRQMTSRLAAPSRFHLEVDGDVPAQSWRSRSRRSS